MKKLSKKQIILMVSIGFLMSLGIWSVWGNTALEINEYEILSAVKPKRSVVVALILTSSTSIPMTWARVVCICGI